MKLLLLPLKLLALPVMLVLLLLSLLGKMVTNLSAYVVGLFLLVVLLILLYYLWEHRWTDAAIVGTIEVAALALQFGAMLLVEILGEWSGALRAFIFA